MKIGMVLILLTLTACASTGPKVAKSKESYLNGVSAESSVFASRGECKVQLGEVRGNWKEILNIASSCAAKKKWDSTESLARRLLEMDPTNPWGHYFLSQVAQSKKLLPLAHWHISKALEFGPKYGLFLYQKGLLLWDEQQRDFAIRIIRESLQADRSIVEAHLFLGLVYMRDFDYSLAAEHLNEVLKLRPGHSEAVRAIEDCKKHISDTGIKRSKNDLAQSRGEN